MPQPVQTLPVFMGAPIRFYVLGVHLPKTHSIIKCFKRSRK